MPIGSSCHVSLVNFGAEALWKRRSFCGFFTVQSDSPKWSSCTSSFFSIFAPFPRPLMSTLNNTGPQGNPLITYSHYENYYFLLTLCFPLVTIHAEVLFPFAPLLRQSQKSLGWRTFPKADEKHSLHQGPGHPIRLVTFTLKELD